MSHSTNIIAGFFGAFAISCSVLVLAQQSQIGGLPPVATPDDLDPAKFSDIYPVENKAVDKGRAVYIREGCVTCHTQQIRDPQNGTDIARGWGVRRTVSRDYIYENPPLLGSSRLGPDLANVGAPTWRNEIEGDNRRPAKRDAAWHYAHLYAPRSIVTESNHPPYRYLFVEQKISGQHAFDALNVNETSLAPEKEIVPGPEAKALVQYLLSLDRSHPLKEAAAAAPAPAAAAAPAPAAPAAPGAAPATPPAK